MFWPRPGAQAPAGAEGEGLATEEATELAGAETGADEAGADGAGADEAGADEAGADGAGADETGAVADGVTRVRPVPEETQLTPPG